jgi:hypothetical protein
MSKESVRSAAAVQPKKFAKVGGEVASIEPFVEHK